MFRVSSNNGARIKWVRGITVDCFCWPRDGPVIIKERVQDESASQFVI